MSNDPDPVVGHKTYHDANGTRHEPLRASEAERIMAAERERCKARAVQIVEWHRNDYNRQQIDPIMIELQKGL